MLVAGRELDVARIEASRAGAPTLAFLHEGLGSAGLWRDFPAMLAERTGCAAIVYSRYGNGFSQPLGEAREPRYMHDEALVVLPALLHALDVNEAVLVGHSDGASIAIAFAAEYPDLVSGAILEAPHLFVEDRSIRSIAAIRSQYETGGLRARMLRHHADADRTFYGWNDIWLAPEFRDWNIESYAARLRAPILAVQGTDDEYGTLAQIEALARAASGAVDRLLLANCGHTPHRDRADLVLSAASTWVANIGPRS